MPIEIESQPFRSSREIGKERDGIRSARERILKVNYFNSSNIHFYEKVRLVLLFLRRQYAEYE